MKASPIPRFDLAARRQRLPLLKAMSERVLVCDGAMGTMLQNHALTADDFGGKEGCNELLVETRPDVVQAVHRAYFAAGADCVETDTFGGMRMVLDEYDVGDKAYELNRRAAALAREVAAEFSTPEPSAPGPAWSPSGTSPSTPSWPTSTSRSAASSTAAPTAS
jgi:5-methyltetrahydrofolate--homocysteine methyltransferase